MNGYRIYRVRVSIPDGLGGRIVVDRDETARRESVAIGRAIGYGVARSGSPYVAGYVLSGGGPAAGNRPGRTVRRFPAEIAYNPPYPRPAGIRF